MRYHIADEEVVDKMRLLWLRDPKKHRTIRARRHAEPV